MGLSHRWVGNEAAEVVARTRLNCYGNARKEGESFLTRLADDPRAGAGDYLVVERDGQAVGTATHYDLTMVVRGREVQTQGVAWVGTIKTQRRKVVSGNSSEKAVGVATYAMRETVRAARERGCVASALMPFRASYYEHFGYGVVERRVDWTIPLAVLQPAALPAQELNLFDYEAAHVVGGGDYGALVDLRRRVAQGGQCDFYRSDTHWQVMLRMNEEGFAVIDRDGSGRARAFCSYNASVENDLRTLRVNDLFYEDLSALRGMLSYFGSLKDQHARLIVSLPTDLPLHLLLKESQVPHRNVSHATASAKLYTRMQLRILDHVKFLGGMAAGPGGKGAVVVAVNECEGTTSTFKVDFAGDGAVRCAPSSASPQLTCPDTVWAQIASGELHALAALQLGLAAGEDKSAALLDALSHGQLPFSREYF